MRLVLGTPNTMSCFPVTRGSTSVQAACITLDGVPYDVVGNGMRMTILSLQGTRDVGEPVDGTSLVIDDPCKFCFQTFCDAASVQRFDVGDSVVERWSP